MRIVDSRRLTGPNLQTRGPAAVAEVMLEHGETLERTVEVWEHELRGMLSSLGWSDHEIVARPFADRRGAALAFAAPIDALYAATEVNEWAIESATAICGGGPGSDPDAGRSALVVAIDRERHPAVVALAEAAYARGLPVLADDDAITIGLGRRSKTWPIDAVPGVDAVRWDALGSVPVVAITGTNGKTTCSRWLARIARIAGRVVGNTTTDGIAVDERIVELGDCTGPGAARELLRRREVELAVLETARGGLLRRGLVLDRIDAGAVLNVGDDHLGEYGVQTVAELAQTKAIVGRAVKPDGRVVLADDSAPVAALHGSFAASEVWFALSGEGPRTTEAIARGDEVWLVSGEGQIVRAYAGTREVVALVDDVALAAGGAARHNLANALAVAALATAIDLPREAIVAGLREFGRAPGDNPGRNERYAIDGVTLLLDFAHNVEALREEAAVVADLRREHADGRLLVAFGMAGDRSDEVLANLATEIAAMHPDVVIVYEQTAYLRGRELGEVPRILRAAFLAAGTPEGAIVEAGDQRDAIVRGLRRARPGDLFVLMPHTDRTIDPLELARAAAAG
jgi:UDP-N-acetylmuramyl tripeptide synthase